MSSCKRADTCSFFNNEMQAMPATADFFRKSYCEDDYASCARNYLFAYLEKNDCSVDDDTETVISELSGSLYPHEMERVKEALPGSL